MRIHQSSSTCFCCCSSIYFPAQVTIYIHTHTCIYTHTYGHTHTHTYAQAYKSCVCRRTQYLVFCLEDLTVRFGAGPSSAICTCSPCCCSGFLFPVMLNGSCMPPKRLASGASAPSIWRLLCIDLSARLRTACTTARRSSSSSACVCMHQRVCFYVRIYQNVYAVRV
jgi:hypothetical protein